jgi:glycosyltransferase involved in cell wall biosynthesis
MSDAGNGNSPRLRVLFLAEGDAEDRCASGSGTPTSVVTHLRQLGAEIYTADVEVYGIRKAVALLGTWSSRRKRWVAKYHLAPFAYSRRSALAAAATRRCRPDVVLQYGGTFGIPASLGVQSFLYCDSHTLLSRGEAESWGASLNEKQLDAAVACERRTYMAAAGIFTFSEYVRQTFLRSYLLAPERVITVRAGPNFDFESIMPRPAPEEGRPHAPTILFVGREFDRKGGPVLLDAFRSVRAAMPNARLLIAGPQTLEVQESGVEFLGYLRKSDATQSARLSAAFAAADVFCLPTRHEPFGIVILEAMFNGLPVVATDVSAIPEMVIEGETGFTVPRDDAAALADRLLRLLTQPDLARRLGAAGRLRVQEQFTWGAVAKTMLNVMTASLASKRAVAKG